jgi:hypothetical protein
MTMRGPDQAPITVIQSLYQLIGAIAGGGLSIPAFPGPLVWSWDRQCELLQIVRDGIPIGAVTIWRTTHQLPSQTALAGHVLESPPAGSPRQYVLDGPRRLCTLFAALREVQPGDQPAAAVGYDLEDQVFLESSDAASPPQVIPLRALSNSVALLRCQRQLRGDRAPIWVRRADELAMAFREYNLPVISIASNDFGVARRILDLRHPRGTRTGEADLVHALTWTPRFNLRDQLESLRSRLLQPLGWGNVDFDAVLGAVKTDLDLDLQEDAVELLGTVLKTDPTMLERAVERLVRAAKLLRDRCGILRWELVPYGSQAVLLADALCTAGSRDVQDLLVDWFWMSTYGEMFAGLSGYRTAHAILDLRQTVSDGQLRWSGSAPFRLRELPRSGDFGVVRVKAMALTLARRIKDACGTTAGDTAHDPFATLAEYGPSAMFSLVPPHLTDSSWFASAGNRFLCHPADAVELRNHLLSAQLEEHEAAAHAVPEAALEAARRGEWNNFIALRLLEIADLERTFVDELLARHPVVAPTEIG